MDSSGDIPSSDDCTLVFRCNSNGEFEPVGDNDYQLEPDGDGWELIGPEGDEFSFDGDGRFTNSTSADGAVTEYSEIGELADASEFQSGGELEGLANPANLSQTQMRKYGGNEDVPVVEDVTYTWDNSFAKPRAIVVEHSRTNDNGPTEKLSRLVYDYYQDGDQYGNEGQLKRVTSQVHDSDTQQWKDAKTSMYRYDTETGRLKYSLHPGDFEKLENDPAVSDPFEADDETVANYADTKYEYDSQGRVSKRVIHGGRRTHLFSYDRSEHIQEVNHWTYRFQEELPSGDLKIRYSNYARQPIAEITQRGDDTWIHYYQYDQSGRRVLHAHPSAVISIDETSPTLMQFEAGKFNLLRDHEGLIELTSYAEDSGKVVRRAIQNGTLGDEITLAEYEYVTNGNGKRNVHFLSKETLYNSESDETDTSVTEYSYEFHDSIPVVKQKTTLLPIVTVDQNGDGSLDTITEVFSTGGKLLWRRDECGFIQHLIYDAVTGRLASQISDADISQLSDVPAGWQTPVGGGQHVVTDFEYDSFGRQVQLVGPVHSALVDDTPTDVRTVTWTVHNDADNTIMTAAGYAHGAKFDQFTLVNPVSISVRNAGDHVTDEIVAVRGNTTGKLSASDVFDQAQYVRWTKHLYDECCFRDTTRVYFDVPSSGDGQKDVHYNETKYAFDRNKNEYRVVSPRGLITHTVFDPRGNVTAVYTGTNDTGATELDPTGVGTPGNDMVPMTENVYDLGLPGGDGHLTSSITHVDNTATRTTNYVNDWRGRAIITDGELTHCEISTFDNRDRVVAVERRDSEVSGMLLSRDERLINVRGQVYQQIRYGVDPNTGGLTGQQLVGQTTYDPAGNPISQLAPGASNPTQFEYDSFGRNVRTIDPLGNFVQVQFDAAGNQVGKVNELGKSTIQHNDPIGRLIKTVNPVGDTTQVAFDAAGAQSASIDGLGKQTTLAYDDAGRRSSQTDPDGNVTYFAYDFDGNQVSVSDPSGGVTTSEFDLFGRVIEVTDPQGDIRKTAYNRAGEVIESIDAKGMKTIQDYDALGRLIETRDRLGGNTQFIFDPRGNRAALVDAQGQNTSYTYDAFNRQTETIYPDHQSGSSPGDSGYGIVTTVYDSQSRPSLKEDQLGDTVTFVYDEAGRLLRRDYRTAADSPSGPISDSDVFTYDAAGNLLSATSERYDNSVVFTYDDAGRRVYESLSIDGKTYTVATQYDARGSVSGYVYPDGTVVSRGYTDCGALETLDYDGNLIDTREYDSLGRMTRSTLGNGVVTDHVYRADSRLASVHVTDSLGNSIDSFSYSWDANKNPIGETRSGTMSGYGFTAGYDAEDRLTSWDRTNGSPTQSWNLSPAGDWDSTTQDGQLHSRTHGPAHELLSVAASSSSESVVHDIKGNMTAIPALVRPTSSDLAMSWDFDNRMHTATTDSDTVTQRFDALGRRVARSSTDSSDPDLVFVQVGHQTIADYVPGAAATTPEYNYVYGSYIDEPVLRDSASGKVYYHHNHQFSVTAVTDNSGGVLERYAYTAYGQPTILDASGNLRLSSTISNRYTFTGREWDAVLNLYHFRARMYDPNLGRFCSRDPIGYLGSMWNLHEFVDSGPSRYLDPFGLGAWDKIMCATNVTLLLAAVMTMVIGCGLLFAPEPFELVELAACLVSIPATVAAADAVIDKCGKCNKTAVDKAQQALEEVQRIKDKLEELGIDIDE